MGPGFQIVEQLKQDTSTLDACFFAPLSYEHFPSRAQHLNEIYCECITTFQDFFSRLTPTDQISHRSPGARYVFHYAYRPPSVSFFVTATTPGWISLAVSPSGKMAGSDAVVASPGAKLQSYLLNGHAPSSVVPASASFRDGSVSNGNGTMTMR